MFLEASVILSTIELGVWSEGESGQGWVSDQKDLFLVRWGSGLWGMGWISGPSGLVPGQSVSDFEAGSPIF